AVNRAYEDARSGVPVEAETAPEVAPEAAQAAEVTPPAMPEPQPEQAAPAPPQVPAVDPFAHLRELGILDEDTPLGSQSPSARKTVLRALGLNFDETGSGNIYVEPSEEWLVKEGIAPGSKV